MYIRCPWEGPVGEMTCSQCVVKPSAVDGWVTQIDDTECGPYLSRDMALQVAVADALQIRRCGGEVRIVVMDARGTICAERCLCDRFCG